MAVPYAADAVFEYYASDDSTVTIADGKVSAWADRVNSYDLAQFNASLRPTVTVVDGVTCLNTSSGYLNGTSLPLTGDATIFAKVYGNGTVNYNLNGMWFKADAAIQSHFGGTGTSDGLWFESFGGSSRPLLPTSIASVDQGVWTTATLRRSGDNIYGGYDGIEGSAATSTVSWSTDYMIGQSKNNYFFKGYISYVLLYSRSLTPEEMAAVYTYIDGLSTGSKIAHVLRSIQQQQESVVTL